MQDNDYIGMAQDLRRIHKEIVKESVKHFYLPNGFSELLDSLIEFEDYCLDQPYEETIVVDEAKRMWEDTFRFIR